MEISYFASLNDRIDDSRTRTHFLEVSSGFINGNFRSAIVMLWSVVIADLLYKLQHLRDTYQDQTSKSILEEIEVFQNKYPANPDWENKLLQSVFDRTNLLSKPDQEILVFLQKQRHLSAHPVLNSEEILYQPSKEIVLGLIRQANEAVLSKAPILSKRVTSDLLTDLESKKDILQDKESLSRFLTAKYFAKLNPTVSSFLFRDLYKISFFLENDDTNKNRRINCRAITLLYEHSSATIEEAIKKDIDYYSAIKSGILLDYFVWFITQAPRVYFLLNASAQVLIRNHAENNLGMFSMLWFLSSDPRTHLSEVIRRICDCDKIPIDSPKCLSELTWKRLVERGNLENVGELVDRIGIEIYVRSMSFDSADTLFQRYISGRISRFSKDNLKALILGANKNGQVCARGKAKADHEEIVKRYYEILENDLDRKLAERFFYDFPDPKKESTSSLKVENRATDNDPHDEPPF